MIENEIYCFLNSTANTACAMVLWSEIFKEPAVKTAFSAERPNSTILDINEHF